MMVLGGGAFEKCLGYECGALMNKINTLLMRPKKTPCAFFHVRL